jgi:hypothetical protein
MIMGTALNLKKMNRTGTEPSNMNLEILSFHFKFLNFTDSMGIFETMSHESKRMIVKSI